jgi:hypothetical protein
MSQVQELSLAPFFRKQDTATWLPRAMALQQKHHEFVTLPRFSIFFLEAGAPFRSIDVEFRISYIMVLFWKYLVGNT